MKRKPKRTRQHGGPRPGSGRKPIPEKERRKSITIRLPQPMTEYLRANGATQTIERLIDSDPGFRK